MDDQCSRGFTLVELLIALAILVILVTGALPAMGDLIERQRLYNAAETIAADLRLFRNEAISRSHDEVVVTFKPGSDWCYGVASETCDCHALITDSDSCTLARNTRLFRFTRHAEAFNKVSLIEARSLRGTTVAFDGIRGLSQPGTLTLESQSGHQLAIKISLMGRVRICTPDGHRIMRYASC